MKNEVDVLLQRLRDGDSDLKHADFKNLSDLSRAQIALFREIWPQVAAEARRRIISALAEMAEDCFEYNFDRIFREALDDEDPKVRIRAIQGLWECEDDFLVGPLLRLLHKDPDDAVRAAAAMALGLFVYLSEMDEIDATEGAEVETALLSLVANHAEPVDVRRRAVESLGFSCNPDVRPIIRQAYEDSHARMRVSALFAMGRSADRRWKKCVLREMANPDNEMRFEAVRAAGEMELAEALPALALLLDNEEDLQIRQATVRSLGQIGGPVARKLLQQVTSSGEDALFDVAQDALEELSFNAECPEVLDLLQDDEEEDDDDAEWFSEDDDYEDEEEFDRFERWDIDDESESASDDEWDEEDDADDDEEDELD